MGIGLGLYMDDVMNQVSILTPGQIQSLPGAHLDGPSPWTRCVSTLEKVPPPGLLQGCPLDVPYPLTPTPTHWSRPHPSPGVEAVWRRKVSSSTGLLALEELQEQPDRPALEEKQTLSLLLPTGTRCLRLE